MKIPLKYVCFTTGIPPMVRGSANIITDKDCEIWFDTEVKLLFVQPRGVSATGITHDRRILVGDGAEMRLKFPEEWPGWEEERTAPAPKKQLKAS